MPSSETYWKVAQVAAKFHVSRQTVHNLRKSGQLKSIRFGNSWLIPEDSLEAYILRNSAGAACQDASVPAAPMKAFAARATTRAFGATPVPE
jgi:excisionase family DNA binding protein